MQTPLSTTAFLAISRLQDGRNADVSLNPFDGVHDLAIAEF
ncbi:hypothetical protein [Limnohabitans sp. B9-3]|nr:hypothetical protein [Limnohabitans sp. B9-3]